MHDLSVIYITANEMPERWAHFQVDQLLRAVGDVPIISISRKPMALGVNLIDENQKCYWNIYMQMLRAAKAAKTEYVAMAEDDVLYTKEHFLEFRPPKDKVSYDRSRWSLFTWDPIYCVRQRISNCSLIAPTGLIIEALTERRNKWPEGPPNELVGEVGREKVDKRLGVTVRGCVEWYCSSPIVQLNHPSGTDETQRTRWKRHGQIKAYDIPHWGKAVDVARIYANT